MIGSYRNRSYEALDRRRGLILNLAGPMRSLELKAPGYSVSLDNGMTFILSENSPPEYQPPIFRSRLF